MTHSYMLGLSHAIWIGTLGLELAVEINGEITLNRPLPNLCCTCCLIETYPLFAMYSTCYPIETYLLPALYNTCYHIETYPLPALYSTCYLF